MFSDNKANFMNMHDNIFFLSANWFKSTSQTLHKEQACPLSPASSGKRVSKDFIV